MKHVAQKSYSQTLSELRKLRSSTANGNDDEALDSICRSYGAVSTTVERILNKQQDLHLLIVEDDDVDREKVYRSLGGVDLNIVISDELSGYAAINRINNGGVNVVLLDYNLGDMTGMELLQQLHNNYDHPPLVIMITGAGDEEIAVDAMQLGVYGYIPKRNLSTRKLASVIYAALRRAELEERLVLSQEKLEKMGLYDSLTGLSNRNLFYDRLNQMIVSAKRNQGTFSVVMVDLNLFKEINDSLGHIAGDDVLRVIGKRLGDIARKSDTISRLGGDEFSCLVENTSSLDSIAAFVEKLDRAISEPITLNSHIIQVGASIGIAVFPDHAIEATSLLSCADNAMYEAKNNNCRYVIFNQGEKNSLADNFPLSNYLPKAISGKELFFEYQPKVNLETHEVVGVEALLRWQHPEAGLISPDRFISLAESSSLISSLTYATFDMALEQINLWRNVGLGIPVSLNISARMLDDVKLVDWLLNELANRNIASEDIILEITETALSSNTRNSQRTLKQLSEANLHLSIDDFGSGFTSFKYIRDVDLYEIKIDRMFLQFIQQNNGKDEAIVRSIIMLAENLQVKIIAEGIETREQWERLKQLGCGYGQGFLVSRPLPAEKLMVWYAAWKKNPTFCV